MIIYPLCLFLSQEVPSFFFPTCLMQICNPFHSFILKTNWLVYTLHILICNVQKMVDAVYEIASVESMSATVQCTKSTYPYSYIISLCFVAFVCLFLRLKGIGCLNTVLYVWLVAQCKRLSKYPNNAVLKVFY